MIWNGKDGTDIFLQNEMPYDPPNLDFFTGPGEGMFRPCAMRSRLKPAGRAGPVR